MMYKLIAIDPSSTVLGYAILAGNGHLIDFGEIRANRVEYCRRTLYVTQELDRLREEYGISDIACERAIRFKGRRIPALEVSVKNIETWARSRKIPIALYSPSEWKLSVIGHGGASKDEVMRIICLQWRNPDKPITTHSADAIAIGLHHAGIRRLERMSANAEGHLL